MAVLKEAKKIRVNIKSLSGYSEIPSNSFSPKKNLRRLLTVFSICLPLIGIAALTIFAAIAGADPAGDIASRQSQAETVRSEMASLNGQLEAKVESYNAANVELANTKDRIEKNEAQLTEATQTLGVTQERLAKRIVKIYRNGSVEVLDVLMETNDIDEFLSKFDMLTKVSEQDRDDFEQVKMLKEQVEEAKVQLASDQETQATLVVQLESEKGEIESGLAQRKQMLSGIEGEIATLEAQQQAAQQAALNAQVSSSGDESYGGESYGPAPVSTAGGAAGIAMQYLGVPYVWGGASPSGMDCSGLVMVVYGQLGISLPHSAAAQFSAGTPISYGELAPGDLVFFGYGGGISHVGIYIGGGSMIHAPFEGEVVQIAPVSGGGSYRGACRL